MGKAVVLVVGAGLAGGIIWYLYKKNQTPAVQNTATTPAGPAATAPGTPAVNSSGVVPVKQTLWKDPDGHIFEMTATENKYGKLVKVDGKDSVYVSELKQGPDGYISIIGIHSGLRMSFEKPGPYRFKGDWQKGGLLSGLHGLGAGAYLLS
ncbi:hypothetical protein [Chryseolinea lacunae]|uniref:Uncharacterized protein n=1 Tax=Chryseolinea lacunae TaxID=2801331 RepID=A0ABS1KZ30_9BACT|nr:hypothetical protein [Chryseolinea lacunae]MBL0744590.1 hypothetical protein [Chryseolinea lacunae]